MGLSTPLEVAISLLVIAALGLVTSRVASRMPQRTRRWVALAFVEYLVCAVAQLLYARVVVGGGDMLFYMDEGASLANLLDTQWSRASGDTLNLLLQRPSAFDNFVLGAGSNTGSMVALAGWLIFFFRGSTYAPHFFIAGLSLLGTLAIFNACRDAAPEAPLGRLFVPTVAFPSVAFWTAAMHKESLCIVGVGLLFAAWRSAYHARIRAVPYAAMGLALIIVFRAPALQPLLLGFAVYVMVERMRKMRGADTVLLGPVYLGLVIAMLTLGMFAVTRVLPTMGLGELGGTVATTQQNWALSRGGSALQIDDDTPQTLGGQLARVPLGLLNALFRPQLFDVHNVGALISALEMTAITILILDAIRRHGLGNLLKRLYQSPFLMMCAVTTLVGCTFVGLVTLNLGSLARYRVPFLPFYGLLVSLLAEPKRATAPEEPRGAPAILARMGRRRPLARPIRRES